MDPKDENGLTLVFLAVLIGLMIAIIRFFRKNGE